MSSLALWQQCLVHLQEDTSISGQEFNTWIRPLQAHEADGKISLFAPNEFVLNRVRLAFIEKITQVIQHISPPPTPEVVLLVGTVSSILPVPSSETTTKPSKKIPAENYINSAFTFHTFVEGRSNELGKAAAQQIGNKPGKAYNPLYIYGDVGLGKTHLMHAVGNLMLENNPCAQVLYIHSERFVADMVKALQHNAMEDFKKRYRTLDALFIDDIQFFSGKERSQEEFFHTFNALLDREQQIIMTSDRYPKELEGLEERLKSRLGWGLIVGIEPPELETRVAILKNKAESSKIRLPDEVAFFIAQHIRSNVRELEGALKRVIASAYFTGEAINLHFAREALKDLLTSQAKLITIDNIQKVVAKHYKLKVTDLFSKRRNRSITRPRQLAMYLSKELTNRSLPEIGAAFGGRDHTTVIHACRKIKELCAIDVTLKEDCEYLRKLLFG